MMIIFNVIFALTCLSVSYLFMKHYPKEINDFIGYRTKSSMSSQQAWLLANEYSSRLIFRFSIACVSLQVLLIILANVKVALIFAIAFWITVLLGTIVKTELMLKRKLRNNALH